MGDSSDCDPVRPLKVMVYEPVPGGADRIPQTLEPMLVAIRGKPKASARHGAL